MSESVKLANEYYQSTFDAGDAAEEEMWRQMDIDDDQWFNSDAYHEGKPRFSREWNKPMTQPAYTRDPEYVQFMRAIRANPADDLPRLVYADWLDEQVGSCESCGGRESPFAVACERCQGHGRPTSVSVLIFGIPPRKSEPGTCRDCSGTGRRVLPCVVCHGSGSNGASERAEFIRLQIEKANIQKQAADYKDESHIGTSQLQVWATRCLAIEKRSRELMANNVDRWFPREYGLDFKVQQSRGFVSHVRCTIAQFEQHAGEIARHHPVTRWELTDREPHSIQRFNGQIDYGWEWSNNFEEHQRFITAKLYERMTPGRTFNEFRTYYDTRKDATVALSAACVQVANERAEALENRPSYREVIDELFDAVVSGLGVPESILTAAP